MKKSFFIVVSPFVYDFGTVCCLLACVKIQVVLAVMHMTVVVPACVHVGRCGELVFIIDHGFIMFLRIAVYFRIVFITRVAGTVIDMCCIFGKCVSSKSVQHVVQRVHIVVCPIVAGSISDRFCGLGRFSAGRFVFFCIFIEHVVHAVAYGTACTGLFGGACTEIIAGGRDNSDFS